MPQPFVLPRQVILADGSVAAGAVASFFRTGTSTPQFVFTDPDFSAPTVSVTADSAGFLPMFFLDPNAPFEYRVRVETAAGTLISQDDRVSGPTLSQNGLGAILYPRTVDEINAGITPSNYAYPYGDIRRYGITPNSTAARTTNTAALRSLISATNDGIFSGRLVFPNTTGSDTYYFNDVIEVKDGVSIDLEGCTIDFNKTYASSDDTMGFLTFVRDVTLENGSININYNGTGGVNAGNGIRIGSRPGYRHGSFTAGIEDEDLTVPQGNISLRNLRITTNNPVGAAILMLGGLDGVSFDNVVIDGQDVATLGIYYEFGFWHTESAAANRKSSHARNISFRNVTVKNIDNATGEAVGLVGMMSVNVEGLLIDTCFNGLGCRPGEALYYNLGTLDVDLKPHYVLENIVVKNCAGTGVTLQGAQTAATTYLAATIAALAAGAEEAAQTDLISFSLDGFSIDAEGCGLNVSAPCSVRNGRLGGASASGQLIITNECVQFDFSNVKILNSSSIGIRANFTAGAIWSPARKKIGAFRSCLIAGNTGPGASIGDSQSVLFDTCRFGYSAVYDAAAEATQTNGISVSATGGAGVIADACHVTTSGGAVAYLSLATGTSGCAVRNPRGTVTFTGSWARNGVQQATATQIADKTSFVNTVDKYFGVMVYDTSNTRLMVAQGSTDVSTWVSVADFGAGDTVATVTPA